MQVWTCRQATWGFCSDSKYITNARHISPDGTLTRAKRQSCPKHYLECPFFSYFDVTGAFNAIGETK